MHQYNFPAYSVGETKVSAADRDAVRSVTVRWLRKRCCRYFRAEEEFPYAIRAVSETFESNGSTSQACICASCMSLMAAGVPIKKHGSRYFLRSGDRRYR